MHISDATDRHTLNTNADCKDTDDHDGIWNIEIRTTTLFSPSALLDSSVVMLGKSKP